MSQNVSHVTKLFLQREPCSEILCFDGIRVKKLLRFYSAKPTIRRNKSNLALSNGNSKTIRSPLIRTPIFRMVWRMSHQKYAVLWCSALLIRNFVDMFFRIISSTLTLQIIFPFDNKKMSHRSYDVKNGEMTQFGPFHNGFKSKVDGLQSKWTVHEG